MLDILEDIEPIARLNDDLMAAATLMSQQEIRYLVDGYYSLQEYRKAAANQVKALQKSGEPVKLLSWMASQASHLEGQLKRAMDIWTDGQTAGVWAKAIVGIGPVIAAGLLAHIDITQAPTAGHWWRFAGLDPTDKWEKGEKRPWNASLKVLAWKAGLSFMRFHNHPRDIYGHIYAARKAVEIARNEAHQFTGQAESILANKRIGKETEAYKWYSQGMLPPAHIEARSQRYAAKLFLAHLHHVLYEVEYGKPPPLPYVLTLPGHSHYIGPPGWRV